MSVTEDDVKWCYRSILGREPDSAEMVRRRVASAKNFRSLVLGFLGSKEYLARKLNRPAVVPLNREEMDIEVSASAANFSLLKERVRNAWTHLGAERPYFSVLSHQGFRPDSMDSVAVERFYALGVREAVEIEGALKRFNVSELKSKTCVEYGCGLGRVTLALAQKFGTVHAYDISARHLELAQKRATDAKITNVKFHLCSPERVVEDLAACDFFYSSRVFQHNPPPIIRALIQVSLESLREGGIAIFQVPTYSTGYSFRIAEYLAKPPLLDMEMHCIPQPEVFSLIAEANCKLLEVRATNFGRARIWVSNLFIVQRQFATKRTRVRRVRGRVAPRRAKK